MDLYEGKAIRASAKFINILVLIAIQEKNLQLVEPHLYLAKMCAPIPRQLVGM